MHTTHIFRTLAVAAVALSTGIVVACSEGGDGISSYDAGTSAPDSSVPDAHTPSADGGAVDAAATTANLTINEVSGKGTEWIELTNRGDAPIDVQGFRLADGDKDGGAPKLSDAVTFPAGTLLAPGEFLVATKQLSDGGVASCPGAPRLCFTFAFGISNKDGDTLHLIAPNGAVAETVPYPAATLVDGETWARIPSATGNFGRATATPNAANRQ